MRPDLDDVAHPGPDDIGNDVEAPPDLRVLAVVAQADQAHPRAHLLGRLGPPAHLVVAQLGLGGREGQALGVLVDLGLPAQAGHVTERPPAVDDRHRRPYAPGHLGRLGGAPGGDELVTSPLELLDGSFDPKVGSGQQAHPPQDNQERHRHGPEGDPGPGHRGYSYARGPPRLGQADKLTAARYNYHLGPGQGGVRGRLYRLLSGPRARDGEDEGRLVHEVRALVAFYDRHRDRQQR